MNQRFVEVRKKEVSAASVLASAAQQSHPNGVARQVRLLRCVRKDSRYWVVLT